MRSLGFIPVDAMRNVGPRLADTIVPSKVLPQSRLVLWRPQIGLPRATEPVKLRSTALPKEPVLLGDQ